MIVYLGEKFFKCEFCDVCCIMKVNFKLYICIKYIFKCLYCVFQGWDWVDFLEYSWLYQVDYLEKCLECSYFCFSVVVLWVYSRVYCKDCFFKCDFCSFDMKWFSSLVKYIDKVYRDEVKMENWVFLGKEGFRESSF